MEINEVLKSLALIVETNLGDLFFSVGKISEATSVRSLCNDICVISNLYINQAHTVRVYEGKYYKFLTNIIPCLIEVLLKRTSKRFVKRIHIIFYNHNYSYIHT